MTVADNYGTIYLPIRIMLITANDTIVLFINPLVLGPSEFENKTVMYLPKTNRMLLGS
jgi:hypothetical protein